MPVYVVGFDVRNCAPADDCSAFRNAVSKLERHRLMPWLYLVSVPFTANALKQYLLNHMSGEDRLWVSRLPPMASEEFAYQTTGGTSAWLKKHGQIELPLSAPEDVIHQRANIPEMHRRNGFGRLHS